MSAECGPSWGAWLPVTAEAIDDAVATRHLLDARILIHNGFGRDAFYAGYAARRKAPTAGLRCEREWRKWCVEQAKRNDGNGR